MNKVYISHKKFERLDFTEQAIDKAEYEDCNFSNCNFSGADLSGINFSQCEFTGCNLSMVKVSKTVMDNLKFRDCKLLGVVFENCNTFTFNAYFENCVLNLSSFYKMNLKKIKFKNCSLQETDFSESDLSSAVFENCDLTRTIFNKTKLDRADLVSSFNYSIDPELNSIKKARFSRLGVTGLLDKYDIEIE